MAGILGKKIGKTSIFDAEGLNTACTIIQAGPCVVTQIKNLETEGYNSIQVGYDDKHLRKALKSEIGHLKNSKATPKKIYKEFSIFDIEISDEDGNTSREELKVGDVFTVDSVFK